MACCIVIMFISLKVFLIACFGILNFVSRIFIDGMCDVALAPTLIIISGSIFQHSFVIFSINGWYFFIFVVIVSRKNLSLQYINSMNCIVRLLSGPIGGFVWYGNPLTLKEYGLNLALQWHLWFLHVQVNNHGGTVFSGGLLLKIPTFIRMQHLDYLDDTSSFLSVHTALLCLLVLRAWM